MVGIDDMDGMGEIVPSGVTATTFTATAAVLTTAADATAAVVATDALAAPIDLWKETEQ